MNHQEFAVEMERRGCYTSNSLFCGTYQGRPFHVVFLKGKTGGATRFTITLEFNQRIKNKFISQLTRELKREVRVQFVNNGMSITATITINAKHSFPETFDFLLQTIDVQANTFGYEGPQLCAVCKQPGSDTFSFHTYTYTSTHRNCLQQDTSVKVEKAQNNELNGNYILGIIGAILGGIIGTIPNVLSIVYGNVIVAWFCALVPLCAYYGYKLFRGKMNRVAAVVTIIVSVLVTPIMDYLTTLLMLYVEMEIILTISQYIELLQIAPEDMMPSLLQTALFVGLGIVIVFGIISRGNRNVYQNVDIALKSARPIVKENI